MDCIGPFGHTIDDVAYLFESINGVDNKDNTSVAIPAYNHHIENRNSCHENKPAQNIRIGVLKNAQRYQQSLLAYDSAINLMSAAGVEIVEIQLPLLERYTELHQRIVKSEAVALHKKALLDENSILSHAVRSVIRDGLKISAADYLEALCLRGPLLDDFVTTAFKQVDILALPVSLDHAPLYQPAEELTERQVDADFARSAIFTRFANYLGIPGLTVPSGLFETSTSNNKIPNNNQCSRVLPGAVQFVAAPFQEEALFDIGRWFEYMRGDIARPSIN
jgi:aspartyl-tRNA(Asn)/glutamyl-tRNA(Gln) amidotransferase subunit A